MGDLSDLRRVLGDPVSDPEEDAFLAFSQAFPSHSLGFIDDKAPTVDITVAGRDLTIHQSRGLLTSDRKQGTTGAVVWKVTPLLAEWIASPNFLWETGHLTAGTVALELGAGVSGVVALTLGPMINHYIATDQDYVIRLLKQNISENLPVPTKAARSKTNKKARRPQPSSRQPPSRIETLELDWELDSVSSISQFISPDGAQKGVDIVIACDCIYNETLIEPFNNTCAQICRLRPYAQNQGEKPTLCLIAQQLRSPEIFESWLKSFHTYFVAWRLPDHVLPTALRENSGFIVHLGVVRPLGHGTGLNDPLNHVPA